MKNALNPLTAAILLACSAAGSQAATYTSLALPDLDTNIGTWSAGGGYEPLFPGTHVWNGVSFNLAEDAQGDKAVMGSSSISTSIHGATKAYTIINTAWGSFGAFNGTVEFFGTNGAYASFNLVQGTNVRDHYCCGGFNNTINGTDAMLAWTDGAVRLDMQVFDLPSIFDSETLLSFVFTGNEGDVSGSPFLAAVTIESLDPSGVPEPGTLTLLGLGLGLVGLGALRRRQAA